MDGDPFPELVASVYRRLYLLPSHEGWHLPIYQHRTRCEELEKVRTGIDVLFQALP